VRRCCLEQQQLREDRDEDVTRPGAPRRGGCGEGETRSPSGTLTRSLRADSPLYDPRSRPRRRALSTRATIAGGVGVVAALALVVGLAFAGSSQELAKGTHIAGVDVGELTQPEAVAKLDRRFDARSARPVAFTAGGRAFRYAANQLGVHPDWRAAVAAAARSSDGFGPIRGFRRLHTRFFGAEVLPRIAVSNAALEYALDQIADETDRSARSAALVRRGLKIRTVAEESGRRLARAQAAEVIARTLGSLERPASVSLPVATIAPKVSEAMLAPAARRARTALSGPVTLRGVGKTWRIPRWRIATLLALPRDGASKLALAGPGADAYFAALARRVERRPVDARFAVSGESVGLLPAKPGTELDVERTARALLRAATSRANRTAELTVVRAAPERTTAEALAMGVDRRMSIYKTYNAGTSDRITNLRLGVTALDGTLVPPGGIFSLNEAIGERTAERGFRSAPVIIGNEYEEEIGGGTSQVATTVFNAAWEAGLRIIERNPHSLYISRYQLGRDATVYWPSLDLKFVNDTKDWVLVKGFAEYDGIAVGIYGGEDRRVESSAGTRTITGPVPVKYVKDPKLEKGKRVFESEGTQPSRTVVTRTVYAADGSELRSETWTTSYRGETRVIKIGTKVVKPPDAEPKTKGKTGGAPEETVPGAQTTPPPTTSEPTPRP
jgi:vancomycin resistance protein YoaR